MHDWWCECADCRREHEADSAAYRDMAARYAPGGDIYEKEQEDDDGVLGSH